MDDRLLLRADGQPDGRGHSEASKPSRFSKGDGRKRGRRPKGSRDERTMILQMRDMPVFATGPDGKKIKMTTPEAILYMQRQKALKGDLKAAEFLMKRFDRYEPPSVEPDHTSALMEDDAVILELSRMRGLLPPTSEDAS